MAQATKKTRKRRTAEEMVADLEKEIARVKAKRGCERSQGRPYWQGSHGRVEGARQGTGRGAPTESR